jgi:RNA polymerase sigma-70 factor (ECF subfamily)
MLALLFGVVRREPDEELVRRFKDGDREAFSEIVRRYQDRVYSLCMRWLGDPALAEEVAQDVFFAAFRSLGSFRGDARFSTWIFRVAVNHCKNRELYRRRRGHGRTESIDGQADDDDAAPPRQYAAEGPGTDALIHQAEADRQLQAALDALEEDQRQIILLRDVEDLSYEEIAEILDLPKGTVKSRLHRARSELARKLLRRIDVADVV